MSISRPTLSLLTASRNRPLVGRVSLRQGNPSTRSRPSESAMGSAGVCGVRMGFGHKRGVAEHAASCERWWDRTGRLRHDLLQQAPRWAYFPILRPLKAEYRSDEEGDDDVPGLTRDPPRRSPPPRRMVADLSILALEPNGLSVHNPLSTSRPPSARTLNPVGQSGWSRQLRTIRQVGDPSIRS